jgi:restriction system protein
MPQQLSHARSESFKTSDDVGAALALLQGALGKEEKRIRSEGAQAMTDGDFDTATSVIEFARRLLAFHSHVATLEKEWARLESMRANASPAVQEIVSRRFFGRRRSGDMTPHQEFFRPILEVLVEMDGGGPICEVLERLGEKMKGRLRPKDYEPHKSGNAEIRWRNTARWARNHLVNHSEDGRMKKGTPSGHWEISEKGRLWLKREEQRTDETHTRALPDSISAHLWSRTHKPLR